MHVTGPRTLVTPPVDETTISTSRRESSWKGRWRRFGLPCAVLGVVAVAVTATPMGTSLLRGVGWVLVAHDRLTAADAIVIAVDADRAGVLEAGDLVRRGTAHRVAVFVDPPSAADSELIRRGVPVEDDFSRMARELRALGVEQVERIPHVVTGSEDQGRALPRWSAERGLHSIVIVTQADHSRRLRRILRRAMKEQPTKVMVHIARYSDFDPDVWWQSRGGLRTGLEELQKLIADVVRHPIS